MNKHLLTLVFLLNAVALVANPVSPEKAKSIGQKFVQSNFKTTYQSDLQLVYTGNSTRGETCFYTYNVGSTGFVIVSADDRFRPIVGYSEEGPFETENMSPELAFYLEKIIEARTSRNAVMIEGAAQDWQSIAATGKMKPRNIGKEADFLVETKWNQDSPYNFYAPEASSGPGGRCYAGCVATAMSQVMKYWDHPTQGSGSHSYYSWGGYGGHLSADFGATTYDWDNMPNRITSNSPQEQIEAVATLMYHCAISVDMGFSPTGSGANSWDVPGAIRRYFSYSSHATLESRDEYSLKDWQDLLKTSIDLGWPLYYSGYSNDGGHAFVCDGYDENDLFHYNWGWGGSSDGWFVVDEIDFAGWAQAILNYVPTDVYDYMPKPVEDFTVESLGDNQFSATLIWKNPTKDIHNGNLTSIDEVVIMRDGQIIHTESTPAPGATMSYTDHYMPTAVRYAVYAVAHSAKGQMVKSDMVVLGPSCPWSIVYNGSDFKDFYISLINSAGIELTQLIPTQDGARIYFDMPLGHASFSWTTSSEYTDDFGFTIFDQNGDAQVTYQGSSKDLPKGKFFEAYNNCDGAGYHEAPELLRADKDGNDAILRWEPVGVTPIAYCIYRDGNLLAITSETFYVDENAYLDFHSYHATTLTEEGESGPSNECNIQPQSSCNTPLNLRYEFMNSNNKVKLSWDAPQAEGVTGYMLYRRGKGEEFKRIKSLTATNYSDNINTLACGLYDYAVCAYYSADECTSAFAPTQDDPTLSYVTVNKGFIPFNLRYNIVGQNVRLHWEQASLADSYKIFRDDTLIAEGITESNYIDETATAQQSHCYKVVCVSQYMESPSNEVRINWSWDIEENAGNESIAIYPSPTTGQLFIEANDLRQVVIYNLMGQEMMRQSTNNDSLNMDLSSLPQGTYLLKAITTNSSETQKIIKL